MNPSVDIPPAVELIFLAPAVALAAAFFLFRPFKPEWTPAPILVSCAVVTAASFALAARVYAGWGIDVNLFTWMPIFDWPVAFGVRVDGISSAMLLMVSLVGALIHLYSLGYMKGDPSGPRFFMVFHLFYLSMIGLILSNNYVQFYLFWEGVGLASYLLIGFWTARGAARKAALQAFLVNRVGDAALLFAVFILLSLFRDTRFSFLFSMLSSANPALLALSGFLLLCGAAAKSAQFPLYFWLPDAMEGPTPASALMHAATMVTAGIYLLIRSWPIVSAVEGLPAFLAIVGASTAVGAGVLAFVQTDLKRILAYSTVSHLGLMAFALGLHQSGAALFHLITHGFFKAALFLCAGNIAHGLGQSTATVSDVGGLWRRMPLTFGCFAVAAFSLAGVPGFAGHYSKDAILEAALQAGGWAGAAGLLIAGLSGLYIFRMLFLTFFTGAGRPQQRGGGREVHEAVMGAPVVFLALGALSVGWFKSEFYTLISSGALPPTGGLIPLPALSSAHWAGPAMVILAAAAAYWCTMVAADWDWRWRERHKGLEAWFMSDFGWRPAVEMLARAAARLAARVSGSLDQGIVDGLVEGSAVAAGRASRASLALASGRLNDYLWWMMAGVVALLAVELGPWAR